MPTPPAPRPVPQLKQTLALKGRCSTIPKLAQPYAVSEDYPPKPLTSPTPY